MSNDYHHGDLKNALIEAGLEVLSEKGEQGLSLRKVAKKVGVSHAAPYAHFADKQALIAAISTKGYEELYNLVLETALKYPNDPVHRLIETAWTYVQYALEKPDQFKITFSGVVETENSYPEYVEVSKKNFSLVVQSVNACQEIGALKTGDSDLLAIHIWSSVHGFVLLLLENQISGDLLSRYSTREMLLTHLQHFFEIKLPL